MLRRLTYLFFFNFGFLLANAQPNVNQLRSAVGQLLSKNLQHNKIKDSTAVYGAALLIDATVAKGKPLVKFQFNNYEVESFFNELTALEKLDYTSLMKKRKSAKFIYHIHITVTDSTYNPSIIDIENAEQAVVNLLAQAAGERESLGSMIIKLDKKVYH